MKILVIDGQGGRLGRKLLEKIRKDCPEADISAVGTNSIATENMMNSGCADHLATGENAVIVACRTAEIIVGPFGIATAEDVDHALHEILPVDLDAPEFEKALEENDDRRDGKRHEQPEHGST